jgi:hypothetical protein
MSGIAMQSRERAKRRIERSGAWLAVACAAFALAATVDPPAAARQTIPPEVAVALAEMRFADAARALKGGALPRIRSTPAKRCARPSTPPAVV